MAKNRQIWRSFGADEPATTSGDDRPLAATGKLPGLAGEFALPKVCYPSGGLLASRCALAGTLRDNADLACCVEAIASRIPLLTLTITA